MHWIAFLVAFIFAVAGFLWAMIRIQNLHHTIAPMLPDGNGFGFKNPMPLWILFGLALMAGIVGGIGTIWFSVKKKPIAIIENASSENRDLKKEIAQLKRMIAESTSPIATPIVDQKAIQKSETASAKDASSSSDSSLLQSEDQRETIIESAISESSSESSIAMDAMNLDKHFEKHFEKKALDPRIEKMSRAVIQSLISGSVKPLESVGAQSLLDHFTINPFAFTHLQQGLKRRLAQGYVPRYLDVLNTPSGAMFLWKIKTRQPGPDILARLAVADGKLTGFWFDGI